MQSMPEIICASKIALEKGFRLVVKEGSELFDPIRLVRSGDVDFGVASADRILQENEGGAQLVIIAFGYIQVSCCVSFKKRIMYLNPLKI